MFARLLPQRRPPQHAENFYRDEVDEFHAQKEKVSDRIVLGAAYTASFSLQILLERSMQPAGSEEEEEEEEEEVSPPSAFCSELKCAHTHVH